MIAYKKTSTTNCTTPIPYEKGKMATWFTVKASISANKNLYEGVAVTLYFRKTLADFFHFLFCMLVTANNCKRHSTLLVTFDSNVHVKQYFLFFPSFFFLVFFFLNLTCAFLSDSFSDRTVLKRTFWCRNNETEIDILSVVDTLNTCITLSWHWSNKHRCDAKSAIKLLISFSNRFFHTFSKRL